MATRTIADGGGDYNSTGTWVEGAVPTSADDVVATATSGALTVTAAAAAKTLILTGYANTCTINSGQTLTVSGNVTLASGMAYSGTGTLAVNAAATLTANSITVSGGLTLINAVTYTLADNWIVNGLLTTGTTGTASTIDGNQITVNAGWTCSRTAGTTTILLAGTGTWTGSSSVTRYCSNPITINTAGTITLATQGPCFGGNTVTYTAGTLVVTGSTVYIGANVTLAGTWPTLNGLTTTTATLTIQADLTCAGSLTVNRLATFTIVGSYDISVGSLQVNDFASLILPDGVTLTVSTAIIINGISNATTTIKSTTDSVSTTLTYSGTNANMQIAHASFTDIAATNQLWNQWGGTLTRTSNITNTSYLQGDYTDPGEAQVASGTSYLYQGATKNGSYAGGGSTVIVIED